MASSTPRLVGAVLLVCAALAEGCADSDSPASSGLPLPSQVSRLAYQEALYAFLGGLRYREVGWNRDKRIRDTGPYLDGTYFGTHPAVRVHYSPEVIDWLVGGRAGEIPEGAMIVKEMYPPPAVRYHGLREAELPAPTQWTVMVRDSSRAVDGWFWAYFASNPNGSDPPVPQRPDTDEIPFAYPDSDFGSYCVRCHASADSEMTFITTENLEGFPGEPIEYEVDDSWRSDPDGPGRDPHPNEEDSTETSSQVSGFVNPAWLALYDQFPLAERSSVERIPPETTDRAVADGRNEFVTSDQCMSCHSGDNSVFGPNLVVAGIDVSPHAEWRWSMMGLAGRDPIFYAQLETETILHGREGTALPSADIENLCLHCHGVMGQRQFVLDNPGEPFTLEKALAPRGRRSRSHLRRPGAGWGLVHGVPPGARRCGAPALRDPERKLLRRSARRGGGPHGLRAVRETGGVLHARGASHPAEGGVAHQRLAPVRVVPHRLSSRPRRTGAGGRREV